jgi:ABC-type oligopeptide transport system substrate-binding subunit
MAAGINLVYDTLMILALDEVSAEYGLLAESVSHPDDFSSVTYRLRPQAKFHDGMPVTPEDVIFSFNAFKQNSPQLSAYYQHVTKVEKTGEREITFTFDGPGNRELPQIVGQISVLPKHWYESVDKSGKKRDVAATSLEPPLGNGAYRLKEFVLGRSIVYERVTDYWGKDLPANIGRDNFDELHYEYFRDSTVALEAFKADQLDWRDENSAKNWATAYDFPAVNDKRVVKEEFPIRNQGIMQGVVLNTRRAKFSDPRCAPRVQPRARFRGDVQAVLLRRVQAHRQLLRGKRACVERASHRPRTRNPGDGARPSPGGSLHHRIQEPRQRQSGSGPQQSARGDPAAARSRLRDPQPEAKDRRADDRRVFVR